jgi:hypothetical protein
MLHDSGADQAFPYPLKTSMPICVVGGSDGSGIVGTGSGEGCSHFALCFVQYSGPDTSGSSAGGDGTLDKDMVQTVTKLRAVDLVNP